DHHAEAPRGAARRRGDGRGAARLRGGRLVRRARPGQPAETDRRAAASRAGEDPERARRAQADRRRRLAAGGQLARGVPQVPRRRPGQVDEGGQGERREGRMITKKSAGMLARYNAWANRVIFGAVGALPAGEAEKPRTTL